MKKILLVLPVVVILVTLVASVSAFACDDCGCDADCSPGFWKNHTEIWESWAGDDYGWMIAGLRAKGWEDNRGDRWIATDILNEAFPDANCH